MGRWSGSVIWITGGGSGLGKYMALQFAREGGSVAVSGRREGRLHQVVSDIEGEGGAGIAVPCDVTDEAAIEAAVTEVAEHFGKIDVVVANAGLSVGGRVENLSMAEWRRQMDVNVNGVAMTAARAIPHLRKTQGRLALVGSVAGMVHFAKAGPYQASKAAVHALGNTLSIELLPDGISCTTIHPGFVHSEIGQVDNEGVFHSDRPDKRPAGLLWNTDDAARVMERAIWKRKREFVFTGHGRFGWFMARHFPALVHWIVRRIPNNT